MAIPRAVRVSVRVSNDIQDKVKYKGVPHPLPSKGGMAAHELNVTLSAKPEQSPTLQKTKDGAPDGVTVDRRNGMTFRGHTGLQQRCPSEDEGCARPIFSEVCFAVTSEVTAKQTSQKWVGRPLAPSSEGQRCCNPV